jgi:hypothetical protein
MSALKPIENARVLGVAAETYPLNRTCAHPECREPADDPHHCFPRSRQIGGSYFVEITFDTAAEAEALAKLLGIKANGAAVIIPHVVGLCRKHHDMVEEHFAWIKLDLTTGTWSWWESNDQKDGTALYAEEGPLNPQPGSVEGKPKRKRFAGEARKKRRVLSIRVPDDADEDGAALFDEAVENLEKKIMGDDDHRPIYFTLMNALDYTLLNADETDFE